MVSSTLSAASASRDGLRRMDPARDLHQVVALLAEAFGPDVVTAHRWFFRELRLLAWLTPWLGTWVFGPGVYGSALISFVWQEQGRIVGHASVQRLDRWGHRWLIANVAVAKGYRNRGIGRRLMEAALNFVRERGGRWAVLQVRGDNEAALHLYRRLGFEPTGGDMQWLRVSARAPEVSHQVPLATLRSRHTNQLEALFERSFSSEMRWWLEGRPTDANKFPSFWPSEWARVWHHLGLGVHDWRGVWEGTRLVAAVGVHGSRWHGTGHLIVWVDHHLWGEFERPLVAWGVHQLVKRGVRAIRARCAADHTALADALAATGFRLTQHLLNMRLWVQPDDR